MRRSEFIRMVAVNGSVLRARSFCETPQGRKARVNPVLCKGDGLCNTKCATGAIQLKHFTDEEIMDQIDAAA